MESPLPFPQSLQRRTEWFLLMFLAMQWDFAASISCYYEPDKAGNVEFYEKFYDFIACVCT